MPPGLCDRLGRSFDLRLEFAIGGQGKPLSDRSGHDSLALAHLAAKVQRMFG